jgi:hypothetical protein
MEVDAWPVAATGTPDGARREMEMDEEQKDQQTDAKKRIEELEENPPEKLEDWPQDEAKYETFGGPEGEHGYHEGPEQNLGPSNLRHREGGAVEIEGEEVDDPAQYKGDPIPGGPTDPDTPNLRMDKASRDSEGDEDGDDD